MWAISQAHINMPITVVYPLVRSDWNMEIKYSLRSLQKWFEEDFGVCIIGYLPDYLNPDTLYHLPYNDVSGDRIARGKNTWAKRIAAANMFKRFIWMNDDIYFVNQPTNSDFLKNKVICYDFVDKSRSFISGLRASSCRWENLQWNTWKELKKMGYRHIYHAAIHIPQYIESIKMGCVLENFEPGCCLFHSAYVTMNYQGEKLPVCDYEMRYTGSPPKGILDKRVRFLNHNEIASGYPAMRRYIKQVFPDKSRFEK